MLLKKTTSATKALFYGLKALSESSQDLAYALKKELCDQRTTLKMIASENFSSLGVQVAMGNWLSDKYSEGSVGRRYYAGCDNVDAIEKIAIDRVCRLFGADHAYVQPHSGSDANMVAIWSILSQRIEKPFLGGKRISQISHEEYETLRQLVINQKVMGLSLNSGGHLTHGYRMNCISKISKCISYDVDRESYLIDYDKLAQEVCKNKPLILIAGYSSYSRKLDFSIFRDIADSVGATLIVDMAHFAGLVAGKVFDGKYSPIPYADVVTSTTHKTLRGPRGGLILCKNSFKESIDRGCPTVLGGPLQNMILAKAISFEEALDPSFQEYASQIVKNSKALACSIVDHCHILTGGTDNHMIILDVKKGFSLNGKQAELALQSCGVVTNRNAIPWDTESPLYGSGIRIGVAALTTLGMKEDEMREIGSIIVDILKNSSPDGKNSVFLNKNFVDSTKKRVLTLLKMFPLYSELDVIFDKNEVNYDTV